MVEPHKIVFGLSDFSVRHLQQNVPYISERTQEILRIQQWNEISTKVKVYLSKLSALFC